MRDCIVKHQIHLRKLKVILTFHYLLKSKTYNTKYKKTLNIYIKIFTHVNAA